MTDPCSFPPDEYLSPEEVGSLHEILTCELDRLLSGTRASVNHLTEQREATPDNLDMAVSESNRDFSLRLADRERRLLRKIQHSLQRIREGEYGACESCGVPITYQRLLARPVATLCIDCKTEMEQLELPRRAFG
jgi:DnaK suppressor protein